MAVDVDRIENLSSDKGEKEDAVRALKDYEEGRYDLLKDNAEEVFGLMASADNKIYSPIFVRRLQERGADVEMPDATEIRKAFNFLSGEAGQTGLNANVEYFRPGLTQDEAEGYIEAFEDVEREGSQQLKLDKYEDLEGYGETEIQDLLGEGYDTEFDFDSAELGDYSDIDRPRSYRI